MQLFGGDSNLIDQAKRSVFMVGSEVKFADVIQGLEDESSASSVLDPTWVVVMATVPGIGKRKIAVARLKNQVNFGPQAASVSFVILVVASTDEKATKSAVETGRTIATLFRDPDLRNDLRYCMDEDLFRSSLINRAQGKSKPVNVAKETKGAMLSCGGHLLENIKRRGSYYVSDYIDGISSFKTVNKVIATTVFLFFSIILPCVAFGALAHKNTGGFIDENRAVIGQIIGGLLWAVLSGQPMLIIATTALVSLYSKVVYDMSIVLDANFYTVYAWVGIWNTIFVSLYAFFGVSNLIRFSTRSVEEIFTLFITTCFFVDAISDIVAGKMTLEYDVVQYLLLFCPKFSSRNIQPPS